MWISHSQFFLPHWKEGSMEEEMHWWVHTGSGNICFSKCRTRKCSWFLGHWKQKTSTFPAHGSLRTWGTISHSYKEGVVCLEGTVGSTNCSSQSSCDSSKDHFHPLLKRKKKTKKNHHQTKTKESHCPSSHIAFSATRQTPSNWYAEFIRN